VVKAGTASSVVYATLGNIVAQVAFVNQPVGIGIPLTTLFTSAAGGVYRITCIVGGATIMNDPLYGVHFSWTDETGPESELPLFTYSGRPKCNQFRWQGVGGITPQL
jgi:hypothetical protein